MSHLKPGKPTPNGSQEGTVKKKRCQYCDELKPRDQMPRDMEGNRFCNKHCKSFYIREEVDIQ